MMVWASAGNVGQTQALVQQVLAGSAFVEKICSTGGLLPTYEFHFRAGERELYHGNLSAATNCFQVSWDEAKRAEHQEFRWRACFALARTQAALQQTTLARHYEHLGRSAFYGSDAACRAEQIPGDILLSLLHEQIEIGSVCCAENGKMVRQLLHLRRATTDHDLRGRMESLLARMDRNGNRLTWFRESLNSFLRAGNVYAAMLCAEELAGSCLAQRDWNAGVILLGQAAQLATYLGQQAASQRYHKLAIRLSESLNLLADRPSCPIVRSQASLSWRSSWN